jgi:hypothetical protein
VVLRFGVIDAPGLPGGASRFPLHTRPPNFQPLPLSPAAAPPRGKGVARGDAVCSEKRNDPPGKPEAFLGGK